MSRRWTPAGAREHARHDARLLLGALGVHLVASAVHGLTHGLVPVELAPWQNVVVLVTSFVGPLAGAVLWLRGGESAEGTPRLGLAVFTASLVGALAFGVYFHFVASNPDHVHAVPADPWRLPFQASAGLVAGANALAAAVGGWCLGRAA